VTKFIRRAKKILNVLEKSFGSLYNFNEEFFLIILQEITENLKRSGMIENLDLEEKFNVIFFDFLNF